MYGIANLATIFRHKCTVLQIWQQSFVIILRVLQIWAMSFVITALQLQYYTIEHQKSNENLR